MMTTVKSEVCPSAREVCMFISQYSAWLYGCGATCIRLEKNVQRIAAAYGTRVELSIMPRHIHVSVWDNRSEEAVTAVVSVRCVPVSFDMNTRLSELSWAVADGRIGFEDAHAEMADIVEGDSQNEWSVLLLASVANASFCRLFGGDAVAMVVVFIATLAGCYLKQILLYKGWDVRAVFMACSFVSSVLGATGILFSLGGTPFIALGTSVLYLVPGIPLLNSFSDMLYRHYVCAFSRFVDAVVLTCCLSIGLCGGMMFMNVGMF
ncbi:threonine/serine exporter family protein [uncultured Duncaniella sp.]|uniref:threonine/serine exporter family protein n=1 Tax=uncultured Duncaniella sp. TaxID=2768039 RepID=UPI0026706585|nr:threonine/serine exporter family protein [uncultured Duncaniella sp.]